MKDLKLLISKCINKDKRAEYELYRECFALLMGICSRYTVNNDDAIDLLNRSFLKIITSLSSYDENRSFEKWAKTILVNTVIDEFRKGKNYRNLFVESDIDEIPLSKQPFDFNTAEDKLNAKDILKEIQKLPEGCREVLNLFVFEGLSHQEISVSLNIAQSTSRWQLAKARAILKTRFDKLLTTKKVEVL